MKRKPKAKPKNMSANRERITICIPHEVLSWFRAEGNGYQTRINEALAEYMWARK